MKKMNQCLWKVLNIYENSDDKNIDNNIVLVYLCFPNQIDQNDCIVIHLSLGRIQFYILYTDNIPPCAPLGFGDQVLHVDSGQQNLQPPPKGAGSPRCPAQALES